MNFKKNLGEWMCVIGTATITVALIDPLGYASAILSGCGIALISGGIIRVMKELDNR